MKGIVQKITVLVVGIISISSAGCNQPQTHSDRMSRLISAENTRLQKELEFHKKQIERLTKLHEKESKRQQKLLAERIKERDSWKLKAQQNIKSQVKGVFDTVLEQNVKLLEENKKLKTEIEKLKNN